MDLQTAAAFTGIVSSIATTLTLIVLIVSIRQNTRSQKVLAVQSLAGAIAAINVPAMSSPELGTALASVMKDWNAATHEQKTVSHYFLFTWFKLAEMAWYQREAGVLDQDQWSGWETVTRIFYHSEGVKQVWWPNRRSAYSTAFQQYLATTSPPTDIVPLGELIG